MAWVGIALLAVSWLFGLGYYHAVDRTTWSVVLALAFVCFLSLPTRSLPRRRLFLVALLLCLPAVFVAAWPYRAACLFVSIACGVQAAGSWQSLPERVCRVLQRVAQAIFVTGGLLLVQGLAINGYAAFTARCHDLPAPLPAILGRVAWLLDIDAAVYDKTIALHSMRQIHSLGATWELLVDPVTFCFLVSLVAACLVLVRLVPKLEQRTWLLRSLLTIAIMVVVWLPLRSGLLMGLFLNDVLRTDYEANLEAMRLFWNSWLHLLLMLGPVLVCWRFWPRVSQFREDSAAGAVPGASSPPRPAGPALLGLSAVGLGAACVTLGICWDPIGDRGLGRVVVEEYHPDPEKIWEPTFKPYDTSWYGPQAGYNYACIYDYCSRFFAMSRWTDPLTDDALRDRDVLIVKVPTRRFSTSEIDAIEEFVGDGGGLLLVGEHTNVYRTSDHLNAVAQRFGFQFRSDCVFGIDAVYEQRYDPPSIAHPIVQWMPPLWFATSCSIDPGGSRGRGVIVDEGLKNLEADYHADNFYPQPDNLAEMRYGAFVQLWATRFGKGRVVAFTDSTIFSNFSAFEPGKAELMLGMIEWLNHRSMLRDPRLLLVGAGGGLFLAGLVLTRRWGDEGIVLLLACSLCGWSAAVAGVRLANAAKMPVPQAIGPLVQVNIDRTLCDCPLAKNGFVDGSAEGFGIFERWILRLGYFTARREGGRVFEGDVAVFLRPNRQASERFLLELEDYVTAGGKLLIVDSARANSTSNTLLAPFDLALDGARPLAGPLQTNAGSPEIRVIDAAATEGGEPFAWIDGRPVGTTKRKGAGTVTVIGFGSRFTDANMGVTADVQPNEQLMNVYQLQFALLGQIVEGG